VIPHVDIHISNPSDIADARRVALRLGLERELDDSTRGRVAVIVTELGTNLVRYATGGRLLIGCHAYDHGCELEVISIDSGPGIPGLNRCIQAAHAVAGKSGTGLATVQSLSTDFSLYSMVGRGTVLLSRAWVAHRASPSAISPRSHFEHSGICIAAVGETMSGDAWDIRIEDEKATIVVADRLGHGLEAADASATELEAVGKQHGSPSAALGHARSYMRLPRDAAVAAAEVNARAGTVVFAGAGNIAGRIISAAKQKDLVSQPGTLGAQARALHEISYSWPDHSIVVLHSDGLSSDWNLSNVAGLLQCDPAVIAGWLLRDYTRGADDVSVVVLKRG
jgi:anti-sigma regulatory factor (Ser/Thr protein kinase)/type III secretion system FlhB-like substrate exporter